MAEESYDQILQAILEESAELEILTQQNEELQQDVTQIQNEFNDELEKKKCELQAIKERKAQMKGDIEILRSTRSQLIQVYIQVRGGGMKEAYGKFFFGSFPLA